MPVIFVQESPSLGISKERYMSESPTGLNFGFAPNIGEAKPQYDLTYVSVKTDGNRKKEVHTGSQNQSKN